MRLTWRRHAKTDMPSAARYKASPTSRSQAFRRVSHGFTLSMKCMDPAWRLWILRINDCRWWTSSTVQPRVFPKSTQSALLEERIGDDEVSDLTEFRNRRNFTFENATHLSASECASATLLMSDRNFHCRRCDHIAPSQLIGTPHMIWQFRAPSSRDGSQLSGIA